MKKLHRVVSVAAGVLLLGFQSQAQAFTVDFDNNTGGSTIDLTPLFVPNNTTVNNFPRDGDSITSVRSDDEHSADVNEHTACFSTHCIRLKIERDIGFGTVSMTFNFATPLVLESFDLKKLPSGTGSRVIDLDLKVITDGATSIYTSLAASTGFTTITPGDLDNYNGELIRTLKFEFMLADTGTRDRRFFIDNIVLTPSVDISSSYAGLGLLMLGLMVLARRSHV